MASICFRRAWPTSSMAQKAKGWTHFEIISVDVMASMQGSVDTTANVVPQKVASIPPFEASTPETWSQRHFSGADESLNPGVDSKWGQHLWYNIYCEEEALTLLWSRCVNSTMESMPRQWSNIWAKVWRVSGPNMLRERRGDSENGGLWAEVVAFPLGVPMEGTELI